MVRFPASDVKERLQRLLGVISRDAEFRSMRVTISTVIKMALLEGLDALESRNGLRKP
jgi:hypothetical protein